MAGPGEGEIKEGYLHLCPEPETLRPGLWCSLSSDLPTQTACTGPQTWATLPPAAALEGHPLILRSPESHHHPSQSCPEPLAVGQRVPLQMKCHTLLAFPLLISRMLGRLPPLRITSGFWIIWQEYMWNH